VVHFSAPSWCGPCKAYKPKYEALAEKKSAAAQFACCYDESELCKEVKPKISSFPTTRFFLPGADN